MFQINHLVRTKGEMYPEMYPGWGTRGSLFTLEEPAAQISERTVVLLENSLVDLQCRRKVGVPRTLAHCLRAGLADARQQRRDVGVAHAVTSASPRASQWRLMAHPSVTGFTGCSPSLVKT